MEGFEKLLQGMQLHPVADHFTVALLAVAILIDLDRISVSHARLASQYRPHIDDPRGAGRGRLVLHRRHGSRSHLGHDGRAGQRLLQGRQPGIARPRSRSVTT